MAAAAALSLQDILRQIKWANDIDKIPSVSFQTRRDMVRSIMNGNVYCDCVAFVSYAIALQENPFRPFEYGGHAIGILPDYQHSDDARYIGCKHLEKANKIQVASRGQAVIKIDGVYWGNLPTGPTSFATLDEWILVAAQNLHKDLDDLESAALPQVHPVQLKIWRVLAMEWNVYKIENGIFVATLASPLNYKHIANTVL